MHATRHALIAASLLCLLGGWAPASAQIIDAGQGRSSGTPGDDIPDFYYYPIDGLTVTTSAGTIARAAGILTVDTDGTDMVAALVGGPNGVPTCDLCDGASLPDPLAAPPLNASYWVVGFINGATQWIRTSPFNTPGFVGVIGEYADPFDIFPDFGLTNYGPGLSDADFTRIFDDVDGDLWSVQYATQDNGVRFTNVTVLEQDSTPVEPSSWGAIKSFMR